MIDEWAGRVAELCGLGTEQGGVEARHLGRQECTARVGENGGRARGPILPLRMHLPETHVLVESHVPQLEVCPHSLVKSPHSWPAVEQFVACNGSDHASVIQTAALISNQDEQFSRAATSKNVLYRSAGTRPLGARVGRCARATRKRPSAAIRQVSACDASGCTGGLRRNQVCPLLVRLKKQNRPHGIGIGDWHTGVHEQEP
jgi:hypothetical protein